MSELETKLSVGSILPSKILVLEEKAKEEKKTASGIVLPNISRNPQTVGKVIMVGEGLPNFKMHVKVGYNVLYTPMSGQKFELGGESVCLLDQSSVLFQFPAITE